MATKRTLSPSEPATTPTTNIYRSSPIEDRSSRFIAIYSPSLTAKELQVKAEFKSATHRIAAWRKSSSQRALGSQQVLLETGHDDDGEKNGGKALESVLVNMNVQGAVVVARWYGGVMLGPVRFVHMKNCAREAISQSLQTHENQGVKKIKISEDPARRTELIRLLSERDRSILVLRGLLAEKQQSISPKSSPAKVPDYAKLPLATLENLEKARDATIGWVLKQIEKVEEEAAQKTSTGAEDQTPCTSDNKPEDNTIINDHVVSNIDA
ncbi:MAG: hypothetical protein Q9218_007231 [Villophora microphyllina]